LSAGAVSAVGPQRAYGLAGLLLLAAAAAAAAAVAAGKRPGRRATAEQPASLSA
jgi:hypothetical protein